MKLTTKQIKVIKAIGSSWGRCITHTPNYCAPFVDISIPEATSTSYVYEYYIGYGMVKRLIKRKILVKSHVLIDSKLERIWVEMSNEIKVQIALGLIQTTTLFGLSMHTSFKYTLTEYGEKILDELLKK